MNIQKLKDIIKNKANEYAITTQQLYDNFFFEQFLFRLSLSNYKNEFVLKGGFLLENITGVTKRSTLDIDFNYYQKGFSADDLHNKISEVCEIKTDIEIIYKILSIEEINEEDDYLGYRININAQYINLKNRFHIDVASGDRITPSPVIYRYNSIIDGHFNFEIMAYNKETILAEKFQTIISRGQSNSRSKDLYDIYNLVNDLSLDKDVFHNAVVNTFEIRKTSLDKNIINKIITEIEKSSIQKERFEKYTRVNKYTKDLSFKEAIESVKKVVTYIKYFRNNLHKFSKTIYLIRHGEDEPGKMGGWSNTKLTKRGYYQVQDLIDLLEFNNVEIDLIISSDLERAKEASEVIAKRVNKPIVFERNLREVNNGDIANLTVEEFNNNYPGLFFSSLSYNESYLNGESPINFFNRIYKEFIRILKEDKTEKIIIVTHNGVIGIIKSVLYNIEWNNKQKYRSDYCTCYKIVTNDNGVQMKELS